LATARERRPALDFAGSAIAAPAFHGVRRVSDVGVAELLPYIDWTFFFAAWELKGKYPQILDHPERGAAARELFEHGQQMLRHIIDERWLTPVGVYGFWPAASEGDDIILFAEPEARREIARFPMLRQQTPQPDGKPQLSLADFIAPRGSSRIDSLGAFAVTSGPETDAIAARFEKELDDYNAILVKALADRLAEAFAELLHQRARRDWGYGAAESLSNDDLIEERYRGIRPAYGYPACPDHSEKRRLFELLRAPEVGIRLTESCAMQPGASVSGLYFAHPQARYFTLGRIDRDQVADYGARKQMAIAEVERWLAPNLGYDPEAR
jgi:5-methyltetrahydrofolate--homocysteine methyltransferase